MTKICARAVLVSLWWVLEVWLPQGDEALAVSCAVPGCPEGSRGTRGAAHGVGQAGVLYWLRALSATASASLSQFTPVYPSS